MSGVRFGRRDWRGIERVEHVGKQAEINVAECTLCPNGCSRGAFYVSQAFVLCLYLRRGIGDML
jgi:hypothetical protein